MPPPDARPTHNVEDSGNTSRPFAVPAIRPILQSKLTNPAIADETVTITNGRIAAIPSILTGRPCVPSDLVPAVRSGLVSDVRPSLVPYLVGY